MTVCNSCRYCEGLCAVFPAMEMRRAFSDGDLNYFANLCHACGACYTDCQFSPPHEFNVNVPKTLAAARAESWAAYAWPRAFAGLFARNGLAISLICGSERRRLHLRICRRDRPAGAGRRAHRSRRFLCADAAQRDGRLVRRGVSLRHHRARDGPARLLARYRRARRHADRSAIAVAGDEGRRTVALSRWRRRRLLQRRRAPDRSPPDLSSPDVLRIPAVFCVDLAWRRSITICWRARRPMPGGTCRWCWARSAASGS